MNNKKQSFKQCKHCGLITSDMSKYCRSYNKLKSGEISISYKNECNKCKWKKIYKNPSINHKEKINFLRTLKESTPCTDCNNYYPYYVMDFDHVIGEKYFGIANHSGKSLDDLKEEISKCEIVCANCHRIRTHLRRIEIKKKL